MSLQKPEKQLSSTEAVTIRAQWTQEQNIRLVLAALTPENRLACEVSWATGWRIGDVLELRTAQVMRAAQTDGRLSIQEGKTGKRSSRRLPRDLIARMLAQAGHVYVFPGRLDGMTHRTRQAVYKDIVRAAKAFRLREHITPHSIRKSYAVDEYKRAGLKRVQELLNHESEAVTMIYALADQMGAGVSPGRQKKPPPRESTIIDGEI